MKIFIASCILLLLFQLSFSQIIPLSETEMIESSDNIVKGKVLSSKSEWTADRTMIFTFTRLIVEEVFSGEYKIGDTVTIVAPGGYDPLTEIGLVVSHQAVFESGEETVVFLNNAEGNIDAIDYDVLKNDSRFPQKLDIVNSYHLGKRKIIRDTANSHDLIIDPGKQSTYGLEMHKIQLHNEIERLKLNKPSKK